MRIMVRVMGVLGFVLHATLADAEPRLQALARATVGEGQGVYVVDGDGTVLVAQAAERAVHPASVTKIATSLALLERLGPAHRFETRIHGTGPLRRGRLEGDLVIEGGGDPFFVDESAVLLAKRLRMRGLDVVAGHLVTRGPLLFDWQFESDGRKLAAVLEGKAGGEARATLASLGVEVDGPRAASLAFLGHAPAAGTSQALGVLRSPPLLHVIKALNCYSNNVFHFAADAIGGAAAVQASARAHVPEAMRDEIVIDNGAGAGTTNRLSPRAAVVLLGALMDELAQSGTDLTAALPVSGIDPGTLEDRLTEQRGVVVGKTGTFGSVGASALVGALRTRSDGVVRFAVLNHGIPVPQARACQDAFVRALVAATGAEPWPYAAAMRPPYLETSVE
jgi:D-alanyl-D-alanine carboxypeptidase/D-alanyl-D-alanine-endopeptidase (penicillin-binding protein 4)